MNPYKLLALDLDGTVLTNDKRVTERTKEALCAAAQAGMQIALVTGRPHSGLPEELLSLPGIGYAITSNGAVSLDLSSGRKIRTALMPGAIALEILRAPMEAGLIYNVFIDGIGYSDRAAFERLLERFDGTVLEDYVRRSRRSSDDIAALTANDPDGIENIWIMGRDPAERDHLADLIRQKWLLAPVLTARNDLEVGAPEADKGLALSDLAALLQIKKDEILAFGDNENDLGMFRAAGTSVAMGNASSYIRQQASLVTGTNEQDGVAGFLEQLL